MARKLGRGLDDLLDDNDVDLPFLSAYGKASSEHLEGGHGNESSEELYATMIRHAGELPDELNLECVEDGVQLTMGSNQILPLVPSDLTMPGFEKGELSADRKRAQVLITAWGIEVRRLIDRLCEHGSL